jgi:hypothetical protein
MRWVAKICLLVLAPGLMLAQTTAQNAPSDPTSVAAELKALREAMAQQQQQIAQQQQQIDKLQKALEAKTAGTPHVEEATLHTNAPAATNAVASDMQEKAPESPLSFKIGAAEFTPGGFVDFENIFRSTNTTNSAATSFGGIPFSNTVAGHLTEFRSTGQYSRLNIRVDTTFKENKVRAYVEGDFNGNSAPNVFVGTNPHTARLRLYWLDLRRHQWEFLGGSSWGLLTPNRVGLSPMPADLALGLGEDANVHVGINHTRASQFRAVWHPNDNFAWGFGIENPQQFVGNEVIFPSTFNAQLLSQFDNNSNQAAGTNNPESTGAPNVAPDFNTKLAWDSDLAGRHFHVEAGGMLTTVKITILPAGVTGATFNSHSKVGGGAQAALNYELFKGFRFLTNGFWGNGVGRYLIGLAPQAVVRPVVSGTGFDAEPSLVHSGNGTAGFEWQPATKTQFGFYYGGMYAQRNFFPDITSPAATKPFIGFGGPNSANSNNRAIQQGTIDWNQTFWRNPQYGAVLLIAQASYLTRAPWFVALGAPKNAHLTMGYLSIRYVLP